jgi:methyl-accepting chemotaxis protein
MDLTDRLKIDRLDLRPKLVLAFVLVAMLVAVTGFIGYTSVSTVDAELESIAHDDFAEADAAMEMKFDLESERLALHEVITGETSAADEFQASQADFAEWYNSLAERDDLTREQEQLLTEMKNEHEAAKEQGEAIIAAAQAGNIELANQKMDQLDGVYEDLEEQTTVFEEAADTKMEASVAAAAATTNSSHLLILGFVVAAFVAAIAIGLFVAQRITDPIKQLSEASQAMSQGDLTTEVDDHVEDDELGRMSDAFRAMQTNLREVFDEVDTFSDNLAAGDDALQTRERNTDFPGTYGQIMTNLDRGATEMVGGFEEIRTASADLQNGRLDQEIDTDRPGNYGEILESFDDGMTTLSASFDQIAEASEGLKDGDLDQRIDDGYPGQYGQALADLDAGIQQLSASIETVQEVADEVATSSEEVSASTEEIEAASDEVAQSVTEISQGADQQSEQLQQVSSEMNDLSATIEEVASSSEEVASTATTAVERAETGREEAADATDEISAIEDRADEAARQVRSLDDEMEAIGEIVDMITEIAEQTNMLALNASIEAARAGEAGEGFGVVADEIKGLAEEAADATNKIEERIAAVQSSTTDTVEGIEEMNERVDSGAETIEGAIRLFDDVAQAIQEAESGIEEISDATDDQAASTEETVSMIDEISSVSQQTAAEASNVSAATEEQASSLSESAENVQHLSRLADRLHSNVSDFSVQGDGRRDLTGGPDAGPDAIEPGSDLSVAEADGGRELDADPSGPTGGDRP